MPLARDMRLNPRGKSGGLFDTASVIEGKQDQLVGKLQERYGYAREQAKKEADEFYNNCNC
jgi:uncharacterized protein YjbJ (UPF0337 family)